VQHAPPISSSLPSSSQLYLEKNGVFWVVTPCGSCKNRRFGGTSNLTYLEKTTSCEVPHYSLFSNIV
jgi:hypothetical protein